MCLRLRLRGNALDIASRKCHLNTKGTRLQKCEQLHAVIKSTADALQLRDCNRCNMLLRVILVFSDQASGHPGLLGPLARLPGASRACLHGIQYVQDICG